MIFPIVAYGHPVLRKVAAPLQSGELALETFIADMWETMYASNGVGLAAPQVNRSIRLFTVDTVQVFEGMSAEEQKTYSDAPGVKAVFINANILSVSGTPWAYNEGCLSIPKVREDVMRPDTLIMDYQDENWQQHRKTFSGLTARVILHEYDHLEGRLFIDHLSALKKKLLKGKLTDITKGKVQVDYKMQFPG
ncbi:MAG: peptide deformylase [Chitinophagia bacterium]|jgi:peptide deformylase|nr:peptide deformylase [Chitinophagia bacterium]